MKDEQTGYIGILPGDPNTGYSNGAMVLESTYQDVHYVIYAEAESKHVPPKSEKDFIRVLTGLFPEMSPKIVTIQPTQKNIQYMGELIFEEHMIIRVIWTNKKIYWLCIEGDDLSLAPYFFEYFIVVE